MDVYEGFFRFSSRGYVDFGSKMRKSAENIDRLRIEIKGKYYKSGSPFGT